MHYIFTILGQSNLFNVWDILNVSILTHKFCLSSFSDYESSVLISGRPNQTHIPYSYFVPISPPSPRPSSRWQQSRSADTVSDILSLTSLGAREGSAGNLASFWTPSLDERFLLIRKFRIWAEHQASEIILIFEILLIETFSWDSPEVVGGSCIIMNHPTDRHYYDTKFSIIWKQENSCISQFFAMLLPILKDRSVESDVATTWAW